MSLFQQLKQSVKREQHLRELERKEFQKAREAQRVVHQHEQKLRDLENKKKRILKARQKGIEAAAPKRVKAAKLAKKAGSFGLSALRELSKHIEVKSPSSRKRKIRRKKTR